MKFKIRTLYSTLLSFLSWRFNYISHFHVKPNRCVVLCCVGVGVLTIFLLSNNNIYMQTSIHNQYNKIQYKMSVKVVKCDYAPIVLLSRNHSNDKSRNKIDIFLYFGSEFLCFIPFPSNPSKGRGKNSFAPCKMFQGGL